MRPAAAALAQRSWPIRSCGHPDPERTGDSRDGHVRRPRGRYRGANCTRDCEHRQGNADDLRPPPRHTSPRPDVTALVRMAQTTKVASGCCRPAPRGRIAQVDARHTGCARHRTAVAEYGPPCATDGFGRAAGHDAGQKGKHEGEQLVGQIFHVGSFFSLAQLTSPVRSLFLRFFLGLPAKLFFFSVVE